MQREFNYLQHWESSSADKVKEAKLFQIISKVFINSFLHFHIFWRLDMVALVSISARSHDLTVSQMDRDNPAPRHMFCRMHTWRVARCQCPTMAILMHTSCLGLLVFQSGTWLEAAQVAQGVVQTYSVRTMCRGYMYTTLCIICHMAMWPRFPICMLVCTKGARVGAYTSNRTNHASQPIIKNIDSISVVN
jgi:hypothetical protein